VPHVVEGQLQIDLEVPSDEEGMAALRSEFIAELAEALGVSSSSALASRTKRRPALPLNDSSLCAASFSPSGLEPEECPSLL
jgi:hypothetical protein